MSGGGGGEGKSLERMPELSYVARATPDDIELVDDFRSQVVHLEAELRDQREAVRVRGSENSRTEARGEPLRRSRPSSLTVAWTASAQEFRQAGGERGA